MNHDGPGWKDVATVILGTGMRPGEVYCLRWENVLLDRECGYLRVVEGKTKAAKRLLPMVPEVYRAMMVRYDAQKQPVTGWVFPSGDHAVISMRTLRKASAPLH